MADRIVTFMRNGAKVFVYELRTGVHLEVSIQVGLRIDVTRHPDGEGAISEMDKKCAKWTDEYLMAHLQRALQSFEENEPLADSDFNEMTFDGLHRPTK